MTHLELPFGYEKDQVGFLFSILVSLLYEKDIPP